MSWTAPSEKRLPSSADVRSSVCDKWDPFISLSPEQPPCHLIHPDGWITAVVLGTNLITYLDSSPTETLVLAPLNDRCWRLYILTSRLDIFIASSRSHVHVRVFADSVFAAGCFYLVCHFLVPVHMMTRYAAVNKMYSPHSSHSNLISAFIFSSVLPPIRSPPSLNVSPLSAFLRRLRSAQAEDSLPGGECVRDPRHRVRLGEPSSVQPLRDPSQSVSLWR